MKYVLIAGTVMVLISAAVNDVRKGKIPNVLLILLMIFQNVSEMISLFIFKEPIFEVDVLFVKYAEALLVILFLYPFFKVGRMGAGDIKLIAITCMSVESSLFYVFYVFVAGLFSALIRLALNIFRGKDIGEISNRKVRMGLSILIAYPAAVYMWFR